MRTFNWYHDRHLCDFDDVHAGAHDGLVMGYLRAIFCKSHPTCDSRVFRISSYFNQLKVKAILEYGRNFSFIRHFVEFLGGQETTVVFKKYNQCPQAIF